MTVKLPDRGSLMLDEGVRQAIEGEPGLLNPAVRASRQRVDGLLDPDFVEFGSSGRVWDRKSMLDALVNDGSAAE